VALGIVFVEGLVGVRGDGDLELPRRVDVIAAAARFAVRDATANGWHAAAESKGRAGNRCSAHQIRRFVRLARPKFLAVLRHHNMGATYVSKAFRDDGPLN
jgi:hypothetical protein